ncbi:MAG: TRAM domain-containing protein, partial [Inquilinus sp.]|nr:TRAM domain-containing protein [Inquilinus sp.]
SDFIVGHPGESDRDFADTLGLVTEIGFAQAYSFKYSARPGTPAATLDDQVPEPVKAERLASLQQLLNEQQAAFNAASVGREMAVLFDRRDDRRGRLLGRSPYMQAVHVPTADGLFGTVAPVRIEAGHEHSLSGAVIGVAAADTRACA